jgi:hypothetical protein
VPLIKPREKACEARLWVLPCVAWHLALNDERSCSAVCSIYAYWR